MGRSCEQTTIVSGSSYWRISSIVKPPKYHSIPNSVRDRKCDENASVPPLQDEANEIFAIFDPNFPSNLSHFVRVSTTESFQITKGNFVRYRLMFNGKILGCVRSVNVRITGSNETI